MLNLSLCNVAADNLSPFLSPSTDLSPFLRSPETRHHQHTHLALSRASCCRPHCIGGGSSQRGSNSCPAACSVGCCCCCCRRCGGGGGRLCRTVWKHAGADTRVCQCVKGSGVISCAALSMCVCMCVCTCVYVCVSVCVCVLL